MNLFSSRPPRGAAESDLTAIDRARGRRPNLDAGSLRFLAFIFVVASLIVSRPARALDVTAFYVGSCQRVLGIPIFVDTREISILTLSGRIEKLQRYEVIYTATYPLDLIPIREAENPEVAPPIRIFTRQNRKLVPLVEGWPVEFSEDRLSLLTTEGRGVIVDRSSIWRIEGLDLEGHVLFPRQTSAAPVFVHPHIFENCPIEKPVDRAAERPGDSRGLRQSVYPQQILAETIAIKRELDRLMHGYRQVAVYEKKQVFYAVPEIYHNETWLALWTSAGSRYGASASRSNNFTPLLRDEFSAGPFSYQRVFITGSGPHPSSMHDEAQTQATYEFKADYFHMELMADLSFILIGSKYRWNAGDTTANDVRLNDVARIKMGVDRGRFSLSFFPVSTINAGLYAAGRFREASTNTPRFSIGYRLPDWWATFDGGASDDGDTALRFLRANLGFEVNDASHLMLSYISRDYDWLRGNKTSLNANSQSRTLAAYVEHHYHRRFLLGGNLGVESFRLQAFDTPTGTRLADENRYFLKAGVLAGLIF